MIILSIFYIEVLDIGIGVEIYIYIFWIEIYPQKPACGGWCDFTACVYFESADAL